MGLVGDSFDLVDGGESSFSQFFDGFVETMEAILVEVFGEVLQPDVEERFAFEVEVEGVFVVFEKSEPYFF